MIRIRYVLIVTALLSVSFYGGCGNKGGKLVEIRIIPQQSMIATGTPEQFNSFAVFGDGTMVNWTSATEWSTSEDQAVRISSQFNTFGLAHSVRSAALGTVIITGKDIANNISSTATLSVVDPISLSIFPPSPFMKVKTSHAFRADALLSTDPSVTAQNLTSWATWTTDNPLVATVGKYGAVVTHMTGTTNVISTYTFTSLLGLDSRTAVNTITVTDTALESLALTSSPSVTSSTISVGTGTVQFGAIGYYNGGTSQIPFTASVTWHSSNHKVATISDDLISKGTCSIVGTGSTVIRATEPITGHSQAVAMTVQ